MISSDLIAHMSLEAYSDLVNAHHEVECMEEAPDTIRELEPAESCDTWPCAEHPPITSGRVVIIPEVQS